MSLRRVVPIAVVSALTGLAWLNMKWIETPLDLTPIVPSATPVHQPDSRAPNVAAPWQFTDLADGLSESLARPLFHATRRPFVPPVSDQTAPMPVEPSAVEVVEQPEPPPALPELWLAGVSASGEIKRALIGRAGAADVQWVKAGDTVAGWRVEAITSTAIVLTSGDQRFTIPLYPARRTEDTSQ